MAARKKARGFQKNAAKIAKRQGVSMDRARAMLAAGTRRAARTKSGKPSAAAKRNPRLLRVRGK